MNRQIAHRARPYRLGQLRQQGRQWQQGQQWQQGKVGWILLWLLGIPIPILLVLFLLRGCT